MKKKLIALFLALVMVMGLSVTAFAEGEGTEVSTSASASEQTTFTFTKTYTDANGNNLPVSIFPQEILKFTVTADTNNPDTTVVPTIADTSVTTNPQEITITIPAYTTVGKYNYTVSEVVGNTQGVTYSTSSFNIQVMVYYGGNQELLKQVVFSTSDGNEGKIDSIVNQYDVSNGDGTHGLTVTKKVTGNLGSTTTAFEMTVTFTSSKPVASAISYDNAGTIGTINTTDWTNNDGTYTATVTINLKDNASATFDYIPAGVSYEVVEDSKYTATDSNGSDAEKGYTVTYDANKAGTVKAKESVSTTVTNDKGTTVDTGITMDSLPYILLLGVVAAAGVVFFTKKRLARED